jgi:riboflavin kinase / FMN adenylyltransferase
MRLLRHLGAGATGAAGYVAAIGGFDGIHLGHRALVERTRMLAQSHGLESMVLSFEPLPKEYFAPDNPPARLTNFRERWRLLEQHGPDVFCVLHFNDRLRSLRAPEFAQLLGRGGVRQIVVGHDFRAGYRGEATTEWFQAEGARFGLAIDVLPPITGEGLRIGSGAIRAALADGNLKLARCLLGRPYSMRGRVSAGEQLGRTLGYPTANLRLSRRRTPLDGIFAVRVRGCGQPAGSHGEHSEWRGGVASLGTRPTVGGVTPLLEVHVFDFAGDLYGRELEVEFVARLRSELRFDNVDAMVDQIHRDAAQAREALAVI